jgi:hypothetical protein
LVQIGIEKNLGEDKMENDVFGKIKKSKKK